jgi:excisionase family DNA binding protein
MKHRNSESQVRGPGSADEAPSTSDMMSYGDAAELLAVPVGTLYAWVHERRVPHVRLGPRLVRFSRAALEQWLASHAVEPRAGTRR